MEPSQLQFIEQNFAPYLERRDRDDLVRQIYRWVFVERKPISIVRQKLASSLSRARTFTITSGKGGVGKTTVSVNLAVAVASLGWRILLLDADLGMANAHLFTGVQPQRTLLDALERRAALEEVVVTGPGRVDMICGASGIPWLADLGPQELHPFCRDLRALSERYDFLLIDTGAGISAQVMYFLGLAQEIVLVTSPDLAATLDGYGVVKSIHEAGLNGKVRLLVNQVRDAAQAEAVSQRIVACAERFLGAGPEVLGYLTRDPIVERANQSRQPLVLLDPANENSARLESFAAQLCGPPAPARSEVSPPPGPTVSIAAA